MSSNLCRFIAVLGVFLLFSCSDTVVSIVPVDSVVVEPTEVTLVVGGSRLIEARPQSSDGVALPDREVVWESSNEGVATVSANGLVTATAIGEAVVTATSEGVRGSAQVRVIDWPVIGVDRESVQFSAMVGATSTSPAGITITNSGAGVLDQLSVTVEYEGSMDGWLDAELNAATAPTVLVLSSDPTGLPFGTYAARVLIEAPHADNSPFPVAVELEVRNPEPTLTAVDPADGLQGDDLNVVLTGTDFIPGETSVDFGAGIEVLDVAVVSDTEITASILIDNEAAPGLRGVSVTNPGPGGGTSTLADAFNVIRTFPEPTLESVDPSDGEQGQTLVVTLLGSGFTEDETAVTFGTGITVDATEFVSTSELTVTISIDEGAELGPRTVVVENPTPGGGEAALPDGFEVRQTPFPEPVLTGISPSTAEQGQALGVTLTGSGFVVGETQVAFSGGGLTVSGVTVGSETQITLTLAIAGDADPGTRTVTVTNPGPGGGTATGEFEVEEAPNPVPLVTGVTPSSGEQGVEGLEVTVTGEDFVNGATVDFGAGVTEEEVVVESETQITLAVTVDADASPGPRDVTVTNPDPEGGPHTLAGGFEVLEVPGP